MEDLEWEIPRLLVLTRRDACTSLLPQRQCRHCKERLTRQFPTLMHTFLSVTPSAPMSLRVP